MRYEVEELELAFIDLVKRERPIAAIFTVIISFLPALFLVNVVEQYFILNVVAIIFCMPAIMGFFVRYFGRLYSGASRVPLTMVYIFLYFWFGIYSEAKTFWFLVMPISAAVLYTISRVKLSRSQEFAIQHHLLKPFDVKVDSNVKKIFIPLLSISFIVTIGLYLWTNKSSKCLEDIESNNKSSIVASCTFDKYNTLEAFFDADEDVLINSFGTFQSPTAEAMLIKQKAESGEPFYQQLYWVMLKIIYQSVTSESVSLANIFYNEEEHWLTIAADSGFEPAMKINIHSILRSEPTTTKQKNQAIELAIKLIEKNAKHKNLLDRSHTLITEQDVEDLYVRQSNNLESLEFEQLENILHAFKHGVYFYYLSDFDNQVNVSHGHKKSIKVTRQLDQSIDVLKIMSEKFKNADASYSVFKMLLGKSDSIEVIKYLTRAAEQGRTDAYTKLGIYYYCLNQKVDSLTWLKKAIEMSDTAAIEIQSKVIRNEPIPECSGNTIKL
ncbi:hypothetical protein [Shewanella livingstonensis]|uniref:Sel1 repeat family protein n=1 Tax=Shewanella livingstonensis TaxID=150120 RepID=A0A3G8LRX9_9GAMM|nr:hypothetical protein [Shewanella livingstonensis]AZG72366.1 hypothetical protein EGC82_06010 [Shewanella livingstonensis]